MFSLRIKVYFDFALVYRFIICSFQTKVLFIISSLRNAGLLKSLIMNVLWHSSKEHSNKITKQKDFQTSDMICSFQPHRKQPYLNNNNNQKLKPSKRLHLHMRKKFWMMELWFRCPVLVPEKLPAQAKKWPFPYLLAN